MAGKKCDWCQYIQEPESPAVMIAVFGDLDLNIWDAELCINHTLALETSLPGEDKILAPDAGGRHLYAEEWLVAPIGGRA